MYIPYLTCVPLPVISPVNPHVGLVKTLGVLEDPRSIQSQIIP